METKAHILNQEDSKAFILAGKAIFTALSEKTGTRFTYKVVKAKENHSTSKEVYFCSVLTGSDNEADYKFFGSIIKNKSINSLNFKWSTKSKGISPIAPSVLAFDFIINKLIVQNKTNNNLHIYHEGRCGRCGRLLTVPESIENGIGPECIKHLN